MSYMRELSVSISISARIERRGESYEEPHAGAQGSGREAVERSDRVDVDGVVGLACHDWRNWVSSSDQSCVGIQSLSLCMSCKWMLHERGQIAGEEERVWKRVGGGGSTLLRHVISDGTHLFPSHFESRTFVSSLTTSRTTT